MEKVELQSLVGGALQEKFNRAFERVVDNLNDANTKWKEKRKITITIGFLQNEDRNDVAVDVSVVEKLSPQAPMETRFAIGRDLKTGEMHAQEYGVQVRGQMSLDDYTQAQEALKNEAGTDTAEAAESNVMDFRKANNG